MDIDLDINNYDLKDIINLFGISYNFSETELKQAKKIVLKLHPDKSNLDSKYFLFFSRAYKILYGIYEFRFRTKNKNQNESYETLDDKKNNELIKKVLSSPTVKEDFNKWFNELFEKTKINDEYTNTGYAEWLKSNEDLEDLEDFENVSKQDREKMFEKKKKQVQSLVIHEDFTEIGTNQYELTREKPNYYSSDIFSKLNFEDLKKAHQESVIPVTQEDYLKYKKQNLEELKSERNQKIIPSSLNQAEKFLKNKKDLDSNNDIDRAFRLMKQDEKMKQANDRWWSNIRRLT